MFPTVGSSGNPEQSMVAQRSSAFNLDLAAFRRAIHSLCYFDGHSAGVGRAHPGGATGTHKRELCQSVCSSGICLTPRTRQSCGSICRASANQLSRPARRSGNRPPARLRVRRLRGSRRRRRGDPPVQPAAIQGTAARGQRGAAARRAPAWRPAAARRLQRSRPGGPPRAPADRARRLRAAAPGRVRARGRTPAALRRPGAQPELRPGRAAQEQAQAAAQGRRPRPQGPNQGASGRPLYDADEDWRAQDEEVDIDNIATSAKEDELARRHKEDELDDDKD